MDRNEWKERLTEAGLADEVVDDFLSTKKDEDLVRMKDMTSEEIIAKIKEVAEEIYADEEAEPELKDEDAEDSTEDSSDEDTDAIAGVLKDMEDRIVQRLAEQMSALEVTVEAPNLAEIVEQLKELREDYTTLQTTFKEIQGTWDEVLKTDTERLRERLKDLSPAQRVRLRATLTDEQALKRVAEQMKDRDQDMPDSEPKRADPFHQPYAPKGSVKIRTVDGKEYTPDVAFRQQD